MSDSHADSSTRPQVTIRRRLSDFGPSGGMLVQWGCTTCCCCCLHWIGAAIGGPVGLVAAWRSTKNRDPEARPEARRYIFASMWIGIIGTLFCALVMACFFAHLRELVIALLWVLAFLPSLVFLPVGLSVLVGAWIANRQIRARHEGEPPQQTGAFRLAWRIAWMSFLFSTLLSGAGYMIMLLIYVVVN